MSTLKNVKEIALFSHNDLDGVSPDVVLERVFPNTPISSYFYNNYDINDGIMNFLKENKDTDVVIFITDLTIKKETALHLEDRYRVGQQVFYFDHHITSQFLDDDYNWARVEAMSNEGRKTCATEMLYQFLFDEGVGEINTFTELANFVEMVRLFDTWDWAKTNDKTPAEINDLYYMVGYERFKSIIMEMLNHHKGQIIYTEKMQILVDAEQYRKEQYFKEKAQTVFENTIEGYKVGLVFAENYHSELGNYLAKQFTNYDLITIVNISENKLSFRTIKEDVNLSNLAKKFGGGGHPMASGAPLNKDSYEIFVLPNAN